MNIELFHSINPDHTSLFNEFLHMDKKYYNDPVYASGLLKKYMGKFNIAHNLSSNIGDGCNFCYILLRVLQDIHKKKGEWRGKFDGDVYRRTLGIYSEYKISKLLNIPFYFNNEFDNGVDIVGNNTMIDVKTMIRRSTGRKDYYANNLIWSQVDNHYYKNTHYLFVNINKGEGVLEILGYIEKDKALNKKIGVFRKEGESFKNDLGDTKIVKIDMLEIAYRDIVKIKTEYDLIKLVKNTY